MSNPLSSLPNPHAAENEPELEVDDLLDGDISSSESNSSASDLEVETADTASPSAEVPSESRSRSSLIALILAGLLIASIAINLKQSRDVAMAEAQSGELERALSTAIERIDFETARANGAEAALDRVDTAVDVVNEQILGLQNDLDGLREATVR
jgi:hypothetical protein